MSDYERGQESAKMLYDRGYRWAGIKQFLRSAKKHEKPGFCQGMQEFLDKISDYKE